MAVGGDVPCSLEVVAFASVGIAGHGCVPSAVAIAAGEPVTEVSAVVETFAVGERAVGVTASVVAEVVVFEVVVGVVGVVADAAAEVEVVVAVVVAVALVEEAVGESVVDDSAFVEVYPALDYELAMGYELVWQSAKDFLAAVALNENYYSTERVAGPGRWDSPFVYLNHQPKDLIEQVRSEQALRCLNWRQLVEKVLFDTIDTVAGSGESAAAPE